LAVHRYHPASRLGEVVLCLGGGTNRFKNILADRLLTITEGVGQFEEKVFVPANR
jgi:hypothetical protein